MTFGTVTQAATDTELDERRGQKSDSAYRTISEVATELHLPQHVLRFWESKFKQISPLKRGGGRRYYRPQDVDLIKRIHHLLHTQGYTIKGVQKLLVKDRQLTNSVQSEAANNDAPAQQAPVAAQVVAPQNTAPQQSLFATQNAPVQKSGNNTDLQLILQRLKALRTSLNG